MVVREKLQRSLEEARTRLHRAVGVHVDLGFTEAKGRVLRAKRAFSPGEVIFTEQPLRMVSADTSHPLWFVVEEHFSENRLDPIWYWSALCSLLTEELEVVHPVLATLIKHLDLPRISCDDQEQLELFYAPEVLSPSADIRCLLKNLEAAIIPKVYRKDTKLLEEFRCIFDPLRMELFLQIWVHNCFEFSEEPLTFVAYAQSVYASHSCIPNAVWYLDDEDPSKFILAARFDILPEDEIAISYLSEEALLELTPVRRRWLLETKGFECHCPRCSAHTDLSRGFQCPSCLDGVVCLGPHDGDDFAEGQGPAVAPDADVAQRLARDKLFLPPNIPCTYHFDMAYFEDYMNFLPARTCLQCGHELTAQEIAQLVAIEKALVRLVKQLTGQDTDEESWEEMTAQELALVAPLCIPGRVLIDSNKDPLQDVCDFIKANEDRKALGEYIDRTVPFHWIRLCWKEKEVQFFRQYRMREEAMRTLEQITPLLYRLHPCLIGTLGWHLERLADHKLRFMGITPKSLEDCTLSADERGAALASDAVELYTEAYRILSTLFGTSHRDYLGVKVKLESVQKALA
ncbi:MAG: uncharacterized protein KVP18_002992 [Porospora cf. gigantea A]|uniref:uncharacterized protein n=1 Tax=Porospora cf. gigantea A TaxID=2853593 RepID=UPI00355A047A|nr:MAG: hypothetical protein KVP18_002992 [Porospora cf. gigantea A]